MAVIKKRERKAMNNIPKFPKNKLKQNYLIYFECSLILSLLIMIGVFKLDMFGTNNFLSFEVGKDDLLHLDAAFITRHEKPPPPPPDVKTPIEVPEDEIIEEYIKDLDLELIIDDPLPLPPLDLEIQTFRIDSKKNAYRIVEEMPKLKGGIGRLQQRIKYPRQAIRDEVQGRVIIQFVVDERGRVQDPVVLRGIRTDCDNEALEAISKSRFSPGKQRGIPVRVVYTMYILFKIQYS